MHDKTAQLMYGNATFTFGVMWDRKVFETDLRYCPDSKVRCLEYFSTRYLPLMHRFHVEVAYANDHVGLI